MASKTKQTETIRARKHRSNKVNMKTQEKRILENLKVIEKVSQAQES